MTPSPRPTLDQDLQGLQAALLNAAQVSGLALVLLDPAEKELMLLLSAGQLI